MNDAIQTDGSKVNSRTKVVRQRSYSEFTLNRYNAFMKK